MVGLAGTASDGSPPFTPRAKKVMELSLREALQLNHSYIGTEHILLGLAREGEGVAARVLVDLGADLLRVRQAVNDIMTSGPRCSAGRHRGGARAGGRSAAGSFVPRVQRPLTKQRDSAP